MPNISEGIFILLPGSCPRGGTWGAGGTQVVKKLFFSNIVMLHIKSGGGGGVDEHNRMQLKFSS